MQKILQFFWTLFFISHSFCVLGAPRLISENELMTWSQHRTPQLEEIEATMLASQNQKNLLEENYAPEVFGKASYAETQERPIIQFLPVFSPIKQAQLGLRKKFSSGFETQLLATADQRSASSAVSGTYNNVTTTLVSFTVQMDLWKNLLGRMSEAERRNAELESKKSLLDKEIKTKVFEISLRRIYWSLVAIEEQLKISERLKVTATQQVADAKKKLQNSIGDAGEVARYEAQLASRNAQMIFLGYQKEGFIKQLKTLLPELGQDEISLGSYDIEKAIHSVLECSSLISREATVPYHHTKYDEVVALLKEVKGNQAIMNQRHSDMDVKLFGTVKSTGVGSKQLGDTEYRGSYGDAYRDMQNNNRTGYEAGINFTIPLGSAKSDTQKTKTIYDEKRLRAMMEQTESQLVSTHTQLTKSIRLLEDVIRTQRMGTGALQKRLQVMRKKYDQARVSVNDLILDQDALLNSEITTTDAQLQAVNLLLDYLMVFTDTPCSFNRI